MGPTKVADACALHEDRIVPPAGLVSLQPAPEPGQVEGTQVLELLRKQAAQFRGSASDGNGGLHQMTSPKGSFIP
jgi:hypothetical protein